MVFLRLFVGCDLFVVEHVAVAVGALWLWFWLWLIDGYINCCYDAACPAQACLPRHTQCSIILMHSCRILARRISGQPGQAICSAGYPHAGLQLQRSVRKTSPAAIRSVPDSAVERYKIGALV